MSYVVTAVPPILIPVVWNQARQYVAEALEYSNDETTLDIVYDELIRFETGMILVYKGQEVYGAGICRVREFDNGKTAMFGSILGGKNMEEWVDDLTMVAKMLGKSRGCKEFYVVGRPGWEKILKKHNFKKAYTILTTKIEE